MRPEDLDEPVEIVPADPEWERAFAEEVGRIAIALAGAPVEHIGSTAVSGLAAKPIVDIMVGVDRFDDSDRLVERLSALGYEDCGGAPGRRYLRRRGDRAYNVQVVERDGPLWETNVLLRDYLRANPAAGRGYEAAKRAAAMRAPSLLAYSEEKRPAVEDLLAAARGGAV